MLKKALIILIPLLLATWLLVLPAAVGAYLRGWLPGWLDETFPTAESRYRIGWFVTELDIDDPAFAADLRARHFPPFPLAWLALGGELRTTGSEAEFDLRGHLGLAGASVLDLVTDELTVGAGHATGLELVVQQQPDGRTGLSLDLADLELADHYGNRLAPGTAVARLDWQVTDQDHGQLHFDLRLGEAESARLALNARPLDPMALAELIEGFGQLRRARPETLEEQLALLTIAGAWQQLAQAGLRLELEELRLAADTAFHGAWQTADGWPEIHGEGDWDVLLDWLSPIVGLARGTRPEMAEREVRAWLVELAERGWLEPVAGRFEFRYSGPDGPDPPLPGPEF